MESQKRERKGKEKEKGKEKRETGRELHASAPWTVKQMHASLSSYMALFTFQSKDVSEVSIRVSPHISSVTSNLLSPAHQLYGTGHSFSRCPLPGHSLPCTSPDKMILP